MTWKLHACSRESSCLANCRVPFTYRCPLSPGPVFMVCPMKLIFVCGYTYTCSSLSAILRDRLVLAPNAQLPDVLPLVSQGQVISADLP